jgi:hypothetical protein
MLSQIVAWTQIHFAYFWHHSFMTNMKINFTLKNQILFEKIMFTFMQTATGIKHNPVLRKNMFVADFSANSHKLLK